MSLGDNLMNLPTFLVSSGKWSSECILICFYVHYLTFLNTIVPLYTFYHIHNTKIQYFPPTWCV
jgi:hypothetical protein